MTPFLLLLVTVVGNVVDAEFNNRPSLDTYIPKYHDSAITIWSEISATCNLPGFYRGKVNCDRCAITIEGNTGICLIDMDIVVSPCLKDDLAQCAIHTSTRVDVSCWSADCGEEESTTIYIGYNDNCGKPAQEGYIFEIDPTMQYNNSVGVTSCDAGYTGHPSVDTIYCSNDDSWDGVTGCEKIGCGPPKRNGYIFDNYTDTSPGSYIDVLSCDIQHSGLPSVYQIYCQDNNTWTDVSGCNLIEKGCDCLSFLNGDIEFFNGTGYGAVANVTCRNGYQLTGTSLITCLDTGLWEQDANCQPIDCGSNKTVSNGRIYFFNRTRYGSDSIAFCDYGFSVNGEFFPLCLADGVWESFTCEPLDCGSFKNISNGRVNFTNASTTSGSMLPVICDTGYELRCGSSIECWDNGFITGYWSTDARCTKNSITGCSDYKDIKYGEVDFTDGNTTFGSVLLITCYSGYKLQGGYGVECMPDGCWETNATCIADCSTYVEYIRYGQVNFTDANTTVGNVLPIICDSGYEVHGGYGIECTPHGYWEIHATCERAVCDSYKYVSHGRVDFTDANLTVGSVLPIICDSGYELHGEYGIKCMLGGTWKVNATCKRNGSYVATACPLGTYGDVKGVVNKSDCTPCPLGTYSNVTGAVNKSDCTDCDEGYYCNVPGGAPTGKCYAGYYCTGRAKVPHQHATEPGYYSEEGAVGQTECGIGYYAPNYSMPACAICPPGFYCDLKAMNYTVGCPAGQYCPEGSYYPQQCPPGTFSNQTHRSDISDCQDCPAGHYCQDRGLTAPTGMCKAGHICYLNALEDDPVFNNDTAGNLTIITYGDLCHPGYYCDKGTSHMQECPQGTYNKDYGGDSIMSCLDCDPGKYCNGTAQIDITGGDAVTEPQPCQTGHNCPAMTTSPDQWPCPPGTFTNRSDLSDGSECTNCTAGYYCTGGDWEVTGICPRGYYCPIGTRFPEEFGCPNGTFNDQTGITSEDECQYCWQGNFCEFAVSATTECKKGTYMPYGATSGGSAVYVSERVGLLVGGTSAGSQSDCLDCPGGSYCGKGTVDPAPCGTGMYSAVGQFECKTCEIGHYCDNATTSEDAMLAGKRCPAGRYCLAGLHDEPSATDCIVGHYCVEATTTEVACPVGTVRYTVGAGAVTDCAPCDAGSYCLSGSSIPTGVCVEGYYCPTNFTNPFNNYPPTIGSYGEEQIPCPATTYSNVTATPDLASCLECPVGYYCGLATNQPVDCPQAYYCQAGSEQPTPCPIGTYGNRTLLKSAEECTACDPGYYCDAPGLTNPRGQCDPGYLCYNGSVTSSPTDGVTGELCLRGGYCLIGSYEATACPLGTYSNVTGAVNKYVCTDCDEGYYCNCVAGLAPAGKCDAGYYCTGGAKVSTQHATEPAGGAPTGKCDAGYYCTGGAKVPTQHATEPGYYSEEGAVGQTECEIGYYAPNYSMPACAICPPGFYCDLKAMNYTVGCPAGQYCPEGSYYPQQCPPGTFSNQTHRSDISDCEDCPAGYYCQDRGLTAPTGMCKAGHICYQNALDDAPVFNNDTAGNLTIITYGDLCHPGYYCDKGTSHMQECPQGTYNKDYGGDSIMSCLDCDPGKYCNGTAQIDITDECTSCCQWPLTTDSTDPSKCRVPLYPYGEAAGDSYLSKELDGCGPVMSSPIDIPIYGIPHKKWTVCTNGYVTFDTPFYEWFPPGDISDISNRTLLAPYFADVDIRGAYGEVYYQAYTSFANANGTPRKSSGKRVIQTAEAYVRTLMLNKDFNARFVLVATWHEAPPYPYYNAWWCWWFGWSCEDSKLATFQLALITDGVDTYVMFIYGEKLMNWVQWSSLWNPDILIGYVIKDELHYRVHPYSFTTLALNISKYSGLGGIKGHWMAYLGDPGFRFENYAIKCLVWHHFVHEEQSDPWLLNECPCDLTSLRLDPWFFEVSAETFDTVCYDSWTWWLTYPNTIRCCYDKWSEGWLSSDPRAGGFLYYSPRTHPTFHQLFDNDTRRYCCDLSDYCNLYRELRPIGTCYVQSPWRLAIFFGDPHITTLDGKRYTFNGLGEYTLLEIQTVNASFSLQGRTERLSNSYGNLTDATIFSAFTAKDNSNASVQVELSADKTEMIIYGNGIDLTSLFLNETSPFSFADPTSKPVIQMSRQNKTLSIFFMSTEIHLSISVGTGMLIQQVTVPEKYEGRSRGLLGNNDGNPDNDCMFADGSVLSANSTERELFPFGQSWMTTPDISVFEYPVRMSHQDFSFPDFVPMFLDDVDDELKQNATQFCGAGNLECIYDMVMTGSEKLAEDTKDTSLKHTETVNTIENNAPRLNGTQRIEMTYGEHVYAGISGFDESALEFFITNNSVVEMNDVGYDYVNITFYALGPITGEISVYAVDSLGKPSAPHVFEIILCTGCNQHGTCNFTEYKDGTYKTDPIKYAICDCDGDGNSNFWTGEDCEEDFNGCQAEPCASGQTCTDVNATLHQQSGTAYECAACPPGYELNDNKCQAVNLCENNDHGCEQICEVTQGSYVCLCETGFRRRSTNVSACDDINECEESQHNCQHRCTNTDGSYTCDCYTGYSLTADGHTCEAEYDACSDFTLDCSATAGCTNETGTAACFCKSGFELGDDGLTCTDMDECKGTVCSQVCTNSVGSFVCSCLPGFQLQDDLSSCAACDRVHWGENCQEICECGPGASNCDTVHGCMCDSGCSGDTCSEDIDECLNTNVCGDYNKICYNTMGSFYCECREGFTEGLNGLCEDINECDDLALNSCEHTCNNVIGSFTCSCRAGYETDSIDPQKCQDLNECATGISECEQNCKNVPGSYNCYCYYGNILNNDRRTCSVVQDFCSVTGALNCSDICGIENEEPVCYCPIGYHLAPDEQTCVDIDECADPLKNQCSHPDTCYNYNGGYDCSCPVGYRLQNDGRTCVECDAYHYGENCETKCDCLLGSDLCHPIAGCICLDGWTGDNCGEDKNECDVVETPCYGNNMECVNTLGSFNCSCKDGFEMVDNTCNDVNECSDVRLNNCEQICINTIGSFSCHCADGFILSNGLCEDINECGGLNDCQQLCINTLGGYRCQCDAGYRLDVTDGRSCNAVTECPEQNKTDCAVVNADCVVLNDEAVCVCLKGYENVSGSCTDIKECDGTPCDHICVEDEGSYHCLCQLGHKLGPDRATCQVCDEGTWGAECNQTCNCNSKTTASCSRDTGMCTCNPGWGGASCANDINECLDGSASCTENSQCVNVNGSFVCRCDTGFTKTNSGNCAECEYGKWGDNCARDCQCSIDNTLKCNSVDGSCHCMDGWTSDTCSVDIDECLSQDACDNTTESCINTDGSYACTCKDGFLRNASKACEACDVEIYGSVCSSDCNCVADNTQTGTTECDTISGFCLCLPQWTGYRCDIDVDECKTGEHNCAHVCINMDGGFECECEQGFVKGSRGECFEHTDEPAEDKSLIIGLGIGLPAAVIIIAIVVILALYYLKGTATPGQITPVHLGQVATPSYKTDWNRLMIHQGKETTFGYDLYESNLPGTSSGNDMPGFSSGGQWNGGTAFCNDLPGTTFGHDSHVTTFGPQYVPDELNGSPSTASCVNP